jgi:hypothetical protein
MIPSLHKQRYPRLKNEPDSAISNRWVTSAIAEPSEVHTFSLKIQKNNILILEDQSAKVEDSRWSKKPSAKWTDVESAIAREDLNRSMKSEVSSANDLKIHPWRFKTSAIKRAQRRLNVILNPDAQKSKHSTTVRKRTNDFSHLSLSHLT